MDESSPGCEAPAVHSPLQLATVAGSTFAFTRLPRSGSVTIGREKGCDVRIDDRSVSRRHAILHLGPPLRIEDLGSVNGTYVGDQRGSVQTALTSPIRRLSRQSAEVVVGERLNLGTTIIVVCRAPAGAAEEPGRGERAPAPPADVVVLDPAMRSLYDQAARVARSQISVLILGETGVGKELLARTLHARSPRAAGPYLELNCAALPESLLEGELFGHEKSAFTGASQGRPGLLESADGGTIFLDEIGEMPLPFQVKLLRVLEDRKVLRVGGRSPRQIDVRFVAATNRHLEAEIARGTFRQDLYFRLNGVSLFIPPLRERVSEIATLARKFLAEACWQLDQGEPPLISPEALSCLEAYPWPGNVRELRNVLERAAIFCAPDKLQRSDLPSHLTEAPGARPGEDAALSCAESPKKSAEGAARRSDAPTLEPPPPDDPVARLRLEMKAAERQRIVEALEQSAGNQTRAAKLLGTSLRTLINRIDEYGIPRPRKKR